MGRTTAAGDQDLGELRATKIRRATFSKTNVRLLKYLHDIGFIFFLMDGRLSLDFLFGRFELAFYS